MTFSCQSGILSFFQIQIRKRFVISLEKVILKHLVNNDTFARKVIPYLKVEYFKEHTDKEIFNLINEYMIKYNVLPSKEALSIDLVKANINDEQKESCQKIIDNLNVDNATSLDWLLNTTEEFCRDAAIHNALFECIQICDGKNKTLTKDSIPKIMQDAIAISFDTHIGHDYFNDAEARFDFYHLKENKIPFDIDILNEITKGGVSKKSLTVLMGGINVGKAQPLDTIIPTPTGFRKFGDLKIGDKVFGSDGNETTVTGVFPQGKKEVFEINFQDGRKTKSCKEHLWKYKTKETWKVGSLEEIMNKKAQTRPVYIPLNDAVSYETKTFYLHPYVIGCLLGDGGLTQDTLYFSCVEEEILKRFSSSLPTNNYLVNSSKHNYRINGDLTLKNELIRLNMKGKYSHEKSIPEEYFYGSIEQRYELLRGLLDTDGYVTKTGSACFYSTSEKLADDVRMLVFSLGGTANKKVKKNVFYKDKNCIKVECRDCYKVTIRLYDDIPMFSLNRKQERVSVNKEAKLTIKDINFVGYEECQCISVSALDHLYLTTDYLVTHNTMVMCSMAAANLREGKNVLYITMEMSEEMISQRIEANLMDMTIDDVMKLDREPFLNNVSQIKKNTVGQLKVKEYPTSQAGSSNFRFLFNELKLKQNFVPDIVYIDYLNICKSSRIKQGSDLYAYVKAIGEEIRGLAVESDVPIITATQFNREGFKSSDPGLENVSESFGTGATADLVLAIVRSEELDKEKQLMFTQLKNRYSDKGKMRRFKIGIDIEKMRLYNVDDGNQDLVKDPSDAPFESFFTKEMNDSMGNFFEDNDIG